MYGNSGRMWANPQGNAGGEGGGTPSEINWSDIQGKPLEFEPKAHEHVLEEIKGLKETLDQITELENSISQLESSQVKTVAKKQPDSEGDIFLNKVDIGLGNVLNEKQATKTEFDSAVEQLEGKKVDKVQGKGLSSNDYTNADKEKLSSHERLINAGIVHSVNGKTGVVDFNATDLGLGTVAQDMEVLEKKVDSFESELENKVEKEDRKGLSTNDFTDAYKVTLDRLAEEKPVEPPVISVNGKKGAVVLTKEDLNLDKIKNIEYAPKEEYDNYVKQNAINLSKKVDKETGKGLSERNFTQAEKEKLANLQPMDNVVTSVASVRPIDGNVELRAAHLNLQIKENTAYTEQSLFNQHIEDEDKHISEADRENLQKLANIDLELEKKVDKEVGKGLSTNDFTNEIKDTYDSATELISMHSKDTDKHLSDADRKAIEEVKEFDSEGLKAQLDKKVDKVEGKELSDVNFTTDYEEQLKNSVSNTVFKNHAENKTLHVTAETHKTIEQLSTEVPELRESLDNKVNKVDGKGLSSNDFTDEYIDSIKDISNLRGDFNAHIQDAGESRNHLTTEDIERLNKIEELAGSQEISETRLDNLEKNTANHFKNSEIHVAPEERENINKIPSIQNDIEALEKTLGEGGNIPSDTIFEELVEGKIYKLGDTIYDVINGNKISGDLSLRFFSDNKNSFLEGNIDEESSKTRLINNHFIVSATGFYADMADYLNENDAFQGMLTKIIDLKSAGLPKVTINGSEHSNDRKMATVFQDNIITMEINPRHVIVSEDYTYSPKQTAKISLNFDYNLNVPRGFGAYAVAHQVVANQIHFTEYEDFAINVKGTISYTDEEFDKAGDKSIHLGIKGQLYNNIIKVCENTNYGDIIYNVPEAELFVDEIYESGKPYNYSAGLAFQVAHNTFDRETARRFTGELTYTPERMKDKQQPIFKNIHLDHYLNAVVDTLPKTHGDKNELDEKLVANTEVPVDTVSVKNSVVLKADDPIDNIPDGTIVFMLGDDHSE